MQVMSSLFRKFRYNPSFRYYENTILKYKSLSLLIKKLNLIEIRFLEVFNTYASENNNTI